MQTVEAQNHLDELLASLRRLESGQRGYLLTGDPQFLEVYTQTRPKTLDRVAQIEQAVSGNASQQESLRRLKPIANAKLDEMSESLRLHDAGKRDEAVALVRSGIGLRHMGDIRELVLRLGLGIAEQRRVQQDMARQQEHWLLGVNIVSVALILTLAAMSLFVIRRANATMQRAQQVLKDSNAELEANVATRTAELTAANEEIQKFAYIVSHDPRSPLVNIMGFTSELEALKGDLFRDQAPPMAERSGDGPHANSGLMTGAAPPARLEADFDEALSFIKASITKMDRLINAVLTISREGNRTLQPEPIDMNEMFQAITSAVAHQVQEANAQIDVASLPTIISDRLAMEQVFSNLVDNALKYLRKGVQGRISVKARAQGSKIIVEIGDNGRRIERRDQTRIFELFRRAGVQDRPGEGLGLAHVRALVRRLGGSIALDSTPREGQRLPRLAALDAGERSKRDKRMNNAVTIVMIEDDEGHARLIEKNIVRAGVKNPILHFATGGAAMEYLRKSHHAVGSLLILLDLNLPDMTGIDILQTLKADDALKKVPVIVLTTTDDKREIERCYELGCSVYITKPVEYEHFAHAIRQLGLFFSVIQVPETA